MQYPSGSAAGQGNGIGSNNVEFGINRFAISRTNLSVRGIGFTSETSSSQYVMYSNSQTSVRCCYILAGY